MQHPKKGIDARLRAAADLVLQTVREIPSPLVLDLGCDHGYLSWYLLRQRQDLRVIASDISAASLRKAQMLMDPGLYGGRICFREADGFAALLPEEQPDCAVLAGMGGRLILDLVSRGRERLKETALVLQANTDLPLLRSGLAELGFGIQLERFAEVNGRVYAVLLARASEPRALSAKEAYLGAGGPDPGRRMYFQSLRRERVAEMRKAARKRTPKGLQNMEEAAEICRWIAEEMGMKSCMVADVERMVGMIAPYETAEEWDNVGLLLGRKEDPADRVLVALDVTRGVVEEAEALGCRVIVTHQPFLVQPVQRVTGDTREGALMRLMAEKRMAHIAAHTNLDRAPGGVNDALIAAVGCGNVRGEGFLRVGDLPEPVPFGTLCGRVAAALSAEVRTYGDPDRIVHALGCCSGSGAEEYKEAMALGADCFLTGEARHNVALDAMHDGCLLIEAGHFETERVVCPAFCDALQKTADALQYNVTFFCSGVDPFGRLKDR